MKAENSYTESYAQTYARLGFPLTRQDGIPAGKIAAAEKRLGIRLPDALRDYYLIAGRERVLNHIHNHLCAPEECEVLNGKLAFVEENQCVVVWGVAAGLRPLSDPAIYQGSVLDGEPGRWFLECRKCSTFLVFMLHLQASFGGGMKFTASAAVPNGLVNQLDAGWHFGGEVNGMRAYSRENQAVCFTNWKDLLTGTKSWRIFAGACREDGLQNIANELGLRWD